MQLFRGKIQTIYWLSLIGGLLFHGILPFSSAEPSNANVGLAEPPSEVTEEQVNFYMGFPAFSGLVSTVAEVNQAMRDAAENPMDQWRRQNVQAAISKMPGAIQGLAAVFMSNELHNDDLPPMQAMLGGFIDVNAADRYKKFMQQPDASLIPEAGPGFPLDLKAPPPTITSARIALSDPKFNTSASSAKSKPLINPSEIADLSGAGISGAGGASSVGFNDAAPEQFGGSSTSANSSASRGVAAASIDGDSPGNSLSFIGSAIGRLLGKNEPASETADTQAAASESKGGSESFLSAAQKDLALLEGTYGDGAKDEECVEGDEREECLEDGVFDLEAAKKKKKGPTRHQHGKGLRSAYRLKGTTKNWKSLSVVISLLPTVKTAQALSNDQLIREADRLGFDESARKQCESCERAFGAGSSRCRSVCASRDNFVSTVRAAESGSGGGGSSGGGGGGGGRGAAGSIIAGAAAIANSVGSAIALVGTTAAQAGAAKSIAVSEANKVVTNTKTKADATLHVANNQFEAELAKTQTIQTIAALNEKGKTFDTKTGIAAILAKSASDRAARLDDAYFTRKAEMAQVDLLMYVQAGQTALAKYAMSASALVRGQIPNSVPTTVAAIPNFGATIAQAGLAAGTSAAVAPDQRLLEPIRAVASTGGESLQTGLQRVAAALRGSTRQQPVRIPPPVAVPVRAIASFEGTPHVPSAERARASTAFGSSNRPTHSR